MLLQTKTDIGKFRERNEDFIAVSRHPKDEDIVVSPYSTFLSLHDVMDESINNLKHLEKDGARRKIWIL